jgi:hypothetical protein
VIGPAPLNQHMTCVSGQPCKIIRVLGTDLQDGDTMHILDTCGIYVKASNYEHYSVKSKGTTKHLPRFPVNVRQSLSLQATDAGSSFSWGTVAITAMGGEYRPCWCAESFSCSVVPEYRVDFGRFDMIGPAPLVHTRTCVSGQPCGFGNVTGLHLGDGDRVMVLDTCGRPDFPVKYVPRFSGYPVSKNEHRGISNAAWLDGSMYEWGGVDVIAESAAGGQYRLCWSAGTYPQESYDHFRVDFGTLLVMGPAPLVQNRTCISGQLCHWSGFTGFSLMDGDRIMSLDTCGRFRSPQDNYEHDEDIIPRWPSSGRTLPATGATNFKGSAFSWGDNDLAAYVTAEGGEYRLCWCSTWFSCSLPEHFRTDAGTLSFVGPAPLYQERTCVSGQVCEWGGLKGNHLSDGDAMFILDTCGLLFAAPPRWSNPDASHGMAISQPATASDKMGNGTYFSWGPTEVSTPGGLYRMCWCANPQPPSMNCSQASDFRTDAGTFHLVGPWPGFQGRTCVAGQPCAFSQFTGSYLSDGDLIMVLDTCANHEYSALDAVVPRFNNGGLSKPSKGTGSQFAWDVAAGTSVTSGGGEYRICWCANGFDCALSKHFHVDAGTLTVIGPSPQYQDRTCVTGQVCWMDQLYGQDLGDGDRILVLDTCGLFTVPPRFVNK